MRRGCCILTGRSAAVVLRPGMLEATRGRRKGLRGYGSQIRTASHTPGTGERKCMFVAEEEVESRQTRRSRQAVAATRPKSG